WVSSTKRRDTKALARWNDEARRWATAAGRDLALDLYYDRETAVPPYRVGVVLDPGEKVWAELPVRFNLDWTPLPSITERGFPIRRLMTSAARMTSPARSPFGYLVEALVGHSDSDAALHGTGGPNRSGDGARSDVGLIATQGKALGSDRFHGLLDLRCGLSPSAQMCLAILDASDARRMCQVRRDIDPDHVHS
ncbi:MAG: hypothetical protein ABSE84_30900, partial [Isosphaeraceae bacterium]